MPGDGRWDLTRGRPYNPGEAHKAVGMGNNLVLL
jgi:hypothetical protein